MQVVKSIVGLKKPDEALTAVLQTLVPIHAGSFDDIYHSKDARESFFDFINDFKITRKIIAL